VRIVQNLLHAGADRKTLREGLWLIREVAGRPEPAAFTERALAPGRGLLPRDQPPGTPA